MLISYCFDNIEGCEIEGNLFSIQIQLGLLVHQFNSTLVSNENIESDHTNDIFCTLLYVLQSTFKLFS